MTGLKKELSSCLGRVDFPAGQVMFHSNLPNGQGARQAFPQINKKKKVNLDLPRAAKFGSCL